MSLFCCCCCCCVSVIDYIVRAVSFPHTILISSFPLAGDLVWDKTVSFFFVLKLSRWHSTAWSFIWSHALAVFHLVEASIDISFRLTSWMCKQKKSNKINTFKRTALPHQKENKRSVLFKAGIKLNAAVFWNFDVNFLFNRYVFVCVCVRFLASLFWNVWILEAIQFRETSMNLLTAPFTINVYS